MKSRTSNCILIFCCIAVFAGCATYNAQKVGPTAIEHAKTEIPEAQLLDVGILVFETKELTPEMIEKEGTNANIRNAEIHFIPYHLKNTLHQSAHWGAIQVVPAETNSVDLMVKGKILESNGEHLVIEIDVVDATQKRWFKKVYSAEASETSYSGNQAGEKDAYQDIYNAIANDMARYKLTLKAAQIETIRTVAKLKFAQEFAPDAFDGYLTTDKKKHLSVNRLPANNDPMMARLLQIREREYMYVDTLNQQYEKFYADMWPAYENWRQLNLTEREAIKKIKRDAMTRQLIGALLVAGAIAAGSQDSNMGRALAPAMAIMGGQVFISGWNVSKEADMHKAAIEELSESFGSEMQPVTMEFEGQQYKLTGSAEEQFKSWKKLLREIYFAETGFNPTPPADQVETEQDQIP
jgi:hypothetical protein